MDHWLELFKISEISQGWFYCTGILISSIIRKPVLKSMKKQNKKGNIGSKVLEFNWSYNPPFIFWTSISLFRTLLWDDDIKLIVLQKFLFAVFLFSGVKGTCQLKRLIGNSSCLSKALILVNLSKFWHTHD